MGQHKDTTEAKNLGLRYFLDISITIKLLYIIAKYKCIASVYTQKL